MAGAESIVTIAYQPDSREMIEIGFERHSSPKELAIIRESWAVPSAVTIGMGLL